MNRFFVKILTIGFAVPVMTGIGAQIFGINSFGFFPGEEQVHQRLGIWMSRLVLTGAGTFTAGALYDRLYATTPFLLKFLASATVLRLLLFSLGFQSSETEVSYLQQFLLADGFFLGISFCLLLIFLKQQFNQEERSKLFSISFFLSSGLLYGLLYVVHRPEYRIFCLIALLFPLLFSSLFFQIPWLLPLDIKVSPSFHIEPKKMIVWSLLCSFVLAGEYRFQDAAFFQDILCFFGVLWALWILWNCGKWTLRRVNKMLLFLCFFTFVNSYFFSQITFPSVILRMGIFSIFCLLLLRLTSGHQVGKCIGTHAGILVAAGTLAVLFHPFPYMNLISLFFMISGVLSWHFFFLPYVQNETGFSVR